MAPPSALQNSATQSDTESLPPLVRSSTVPSLPSHHNSESTVRSHRRADPSHLAPEDAFTSPPQKSLGFDYGSNGSGNELRPRRVHRNDGGSRSRSRRRKRFQKLLWVKQSYADNYTDQATFLENLQRNPRVQPYEFWPLVADSTVIVQHVCSVICFVVCFAGIFLERVSPNTVVGWGSFSTVIGWLLWDWWVGDQSEEDPEEGLARSRSGRNFRDSREFGPPRRQDSGLGGVTNNAHPNISTTTISSVSNLPSAASSTSNLLPPPAPHTQDTLQPPFQRHSVSLSSTSGNSSSLLLPRHGHSTSVTSLVSQSSTNGHGRASSNRGPASASASPDSALKHRPSSPLRNSRLNLRLATIKSAVLIYSTLLGLSPILKSLTRSTSSDSIWAMSFWLLAINIFFFDYSTDINPRKAAPVASLSTNAALMASTVLASRLPSTGQVFSLTLFSIEVFGLFPVFRRYARQRSWRYHVVLTVLLVLGAGGGVGMVMGGGWKTGLAGMVVGCLVSTLAMGGCSWWLIGLQKYKNEIYGPWDPARPIIISRRGWDDE
ncbi:phosphatidylinositol N-acetylglucosaminyltransferase-domain-containing protein [Coniochaeta sp. 2T2.1]|nr:phosphatidylinositol N-acetylglucosaminyltransferase-domain-containing protein [Coniochaeta sp. 2T2.1]